jgi:hypothetical protein
MQPMQQKTLGQLKRLKLKSLSNPNLEIDWVFYQIRLI